MFTEAHQIVRAEHLTRDAFVYVRQSTPRQVMDHTESTKRQYALRDRAVALGWPFERIHTIDADLGISGAHAHNRDGFQHLVSEVALGHAGIVLGLEVSRLARNNVDWQRLLELCALSACLIGDEDGLYNPAHFNDRLLLGLKGTMSEAELHQLKARLIGGQRNKARRGELEVPLPMGLVFDAAHAVVLDPDPRIRAILSFIFELFAEMRSACALCARFRREGREFPRRLHRGIGKGEVIWGPLDQGRLLDILHNPRYAGAFVYGRHRTTLKANGKSKIVELPQEQWQVLIQNAHPGYLSWARFLCNQVTLKQNHEQSDFAAVRTRTVEREALLQGRVLCGVCGARMQVRHAPRDERSATAYLCDDPASRRRGTLCQSTRAEPIDAAIGALLFKSVNPASLQVALTVEQEIAAHQRRTEGRRDRELGVARRAAEIKRRRFLSCDPDHRLVADTLEADWNEQLRKLDALTQAQARERGHEVERLGKESRTRVMALAQEFARIWHDPTTVSGERRRLLGLLIEDITLIKTSAHTTAHVRFRGGQVATLNIAPPAPSPRVCKTSTAVTQQLDELFKTCSDREAGIRLNALGMRDWRGQAFTTKRVRSVREHCGLASRFERLRAAGYLTAREMAQQIGLCAGRVYQLGLSGFLLRQSYGNGERWLFAPLKGVLFARGHGARYHPVPARLIPAPDSPATTTRSEAC